MPDQKIFPTTADATGGLILSPKINEAGKPTQHSIKDVAQAQQVVRTVIQSNRNRQIVNSRIMAKFNAERPYDQYKLEQEGLGWRSNFTTKPLPQMIEKVSPRFVDAVGGLKYLTNSHLPASVPGAAMKSEKFQAGVTKVIRSRKGWRTLVEDIAQENALFGHTGVAWLDEFTWFPKHFKQNEFFLSDGTKQLTSSAQMVILKETFLPHELFDLIRDKEAAVAVGWDIEETIKAINEASPSQLRDNLTTSGSTDAWYQNAQRELTVGASYMGGSSVVVVYSLLAREVTGKVSHYRMSGTEMTLIFSMEDRFKSMDECTSFFAFQKGNGTMHGSKGIGREIYEMAGMIDRTRNEVVDRAILSGKTFVQGDIKRIHTFKMSVVGAVAIVPTGWQFLEQKIDGNIEPFLKLDAYFSQLVDQLIGSVSPRLLQGERVTKAQVDLYASREEEGKDTRIQRFLEFAVDMIGTMQRRICDADVIDEDAKEFQKEMLESMTREEFDQIAKDTVAGSVRDLTPVQRQMIVQISSEKRGNPLYNQKKLEEQDLTARISADFAASVLLPDEDPTEKAEQSRLQQMELALLSQGQSVPVSPRDNHEIHMGILMPVAEKLGEAMMNGGASTTAFEVVIAHLNEHVTRAEAQGAPKEALAPIKELIKKALPAINQLHQLDQQAAQVHDASRGVEAQPEPAPV